MDDHDDSIFYVCICLDWMLTCAAGCDIDNVVFKTEVATIDDLHVDIFNAVQKTLVNLLLPFSSKAVAFRYTLTSPLPVIILNNRHSKDLVVFKASETIKAHMTMMSGFITYLSQHRGKVVEE
jgi:hypothetical protein